MRLPNRASASLNYIREALKDKAVSKQRDTDDSFAKAWDALDYIERGCLVREDNKKDTEIKWGRFDEKTWNAIIGTFVCANISQMSEYEYSIVILCRDGTDDYRSVYSKHTITVEHAMTLAEDLITKYYPGSKTTRDGTSL